MRRKLIFAPAAAIALVLSACADTEDGDGNGDGDGAWPSELVLTLTPSVEVGTLIDDAGPLAEMIAERLNAYDQAPDGGITIQPDVPTDYSGVIVALEADQAHIAGGLGPAQMVQAQAQAGATLAVQSVRDGETTYVTQWFTNDPDTYCDDDPVDVDGYLFCNGVAAATGPNDGPIGTDAIARAAGQRVAFVSQGSASGHLVPSVQLFEAGIDPQTGVDPTFAGGHDNSVLAVYDDDADVGVSFNDAREIVVEQAPDVGEVVVVFAWSFPIPNDGFAVAGSLPDDLKQAITDALVEISQTPEGSAVLDDLYRISELAPVTDLSVYDPIRTLISDLSDLLD